MVELAVCSGDCQAVVAAFVLLVNFFDLIDRCVFASFLLQRGTADHDWLGSYTASHTGAVARDGFSPGELCGSDGWNGRCICRRDSDGYRRVAIRRVGFGTSIVNADHGGPRTLNLLGRYGTDNGIVAVDGSRNATT